MLGATRALAFNTWRSPSGDGVQFQWSWPEKINRPQIQNLFHLGFIGQKSNALFLSGTFEHAT
jgi:hypothetical protein